MSIGEVGVFVGIKSALIGDNKDGGVNDINTRQGSVMMMSMYLGSVSQMVNL